MHIPQEYVDLYDKAMLIPQELVSVRVLIWAGATTDMVREMIMSKLTVFVG
jgi:hypothetical protein